ncbi:hypothetical protein EVAR_103233_1 [Eumeta japonica]|uniref:Uncharacterized protein n=1 Tax=Eumeta variegata TaxID=151549 RepID=A0A4C1XAI8_EUMVA|nr:hypothetical protein EVAR_103233_1 [Eumeta japonica]
MKRIIHDLHKRYSRWVSHKMSRKPPGFSSTSTSVHVHVHVHFNKTSHSHNRLMGNVNTELGQTTAPTAAPALAS